ncbi:hypothetical protein [Kitasatospora brasiliensis]|uniref:hypothetical protein n=1 Tax=Kitasatospora brasiliensis TaxID=3058040 RepID=UPI00292EDF62|nr:hypothetical protein [Kitasatospora sp. K002]
MAATRSDQGPRGGPRRLGGAGFSYANGFLDFGMLMVRRGNRRTHLSPEPVTGLGTAVLDALDERGWAAFHALAGND